MGNIVFYIVQLFTVVALIAAAVSFSGCDLIEGVIKVTFWGIVIILAIIVAIGVAIYRFMKRRL